MIEEYEDEPNESELFLCQNFEECGGEMIEWCLICDAVYPCGTPHEITGTKFVCPICETDE